MIRELPVTCIYGMISLHVEAGGVYIVTEVKG
jgi:hypothetical protein